MPQACLWLNVVLPSQGSYLWLTSTLKECSIRPALFPSPFHQQLQLEVRLDTDSHLTRLDWRQHYYSGAPSRYCVILEFVPPVEDLKITSNAQVLQGGEAQPGERGEIFNLNTQRREGRKARRRFK